MASQLDQKLRSHPSIYITGIDLNILLGGTKNSCYAKIKRAVAKGDLIRVKRGLYCISESLSGKKIHPFELAQRIYNPSYISLESALSYHQLIPETVHTITSVTTKRAKEFKTPFGLFIYMHLPRNNFFVEVERIVKDNRLFFIAMPWKAITDYVFCYKKDWKDAKPLTDSLRIDFDDLPYPTKEMLLSLQKFYKNKRINRFLRGIRREFKL